MLTAKTLEDIAKRYKKVLATYRKNGSISTAFHSDGVDRKTVVMSAPLAEIMLVASEVLRLTALKRRSTNTPKGSAKIQPQRRATL